MGTGVAVAAGTGVGVTGTGVHVGTGVQVGSGVCVGSGVLVDSAVTTITIGVDVGSAAVVAITGIGFCGDELMLEIQNPTPTVAMMPTAVPMIARTLLCICLMIFRMKIGSAKLIYE